MKSLLSLIICISMLLGAAPMEAVPQTQTVFTLRNIRVCANEECIEVAPEAKLTVALGSEQANAVLELLGGETPVLLALQSEPERLVLVPNSGRMFSADTSLSIPAVAEGSTDALVKLDAMQPFFETLRTILSEEEEESEDVLAVLFDALGKTEKAQATENSVTIDEETALDGKTVKTQLTLEEFFEMLDEIAAGTGAIAELAQAGLQCIVKDDGSAYESYAELAENASEQILPVEQTLARGEGVRYDRLEIKPEIEEGEKGVCSLEITSWDEQGASALFHLGFDETDESLEYDAQIDLEGTVAAPVCIAVKSDMTDTKTPEEEIEETETRHLELNLTNTDGLWNAAGDLSLVHTETGEDPVETNVTIGYTETVEAGEDEAAEPAEVEAEETEEPEAVLPVIGAAAISVSSEEANYNIYFEIVREQEAFDDILEPLAEMQLTESTQEIPAMVFGLDLEEMNAKIRALFEIESVEKAAEMLRIDLSNVVLPGENVTPEETPEPTETEAPEETPIVVEEEIQQAIVEDEPLAEEDVQVDSVESQFLVA